MAMKTAEEWMDYLVKEAVAAQSHLTITFPEIIDIQRDVLDAVAEAECRYCRGADDWERIPEREASEAPGWFHIHKVTLCPHECNAWRVHDMKADLEPTP